MHVLIPVFFKAIHGGLHENVLATARFLIDNDHIVTIVCPSGLFSDSLAGYGIDVIRTDYTNLDEALNEALNKHAVEPVDLVHAHPFASRKFGQKLASHLNIPFVLTFHGKYTDDLSQYADTASAILAVSAGVRDFLQSEKAIAPEKFHVVPNVPDTCFFQPVLEHPQDKVSKLSVALVSRLDMDKVFILDVFVDAVEYAAKHYSGQLSWVVVGDGTQSEAFRTRLEAVRGDNTVEFKGWLEGHELRSAYQSSDFVFAPGRCALEAMSCGVPAIAVGSKGYCGLVNAETWQSGVYSNFGGVGNKHADYTPEMVHQDLDRLLESKNYRETLGIFSIQIIQQFYNSEKVHEQLLGIYRLAIVSHSLNKANNNGQIQLDDDLLHSQTKKSSNMVEENLKQLEERLLKNSKNNTDKTTRDLITVQNRLYAQLESLSWLQRRLSIKGQLPPLRGWATSPDVLLRLHAHIMSTRPSVVVECGSGASTLVIADALRQNGVGRLISMEHDAFYGAQTMDTLKAEQLESWVDLRIGELTPWEHDHLNPEDAEKPSYWYQASLLDDVTNVDLLWVDGPPGATCLFSRYPALPVLADRLSPQAEVWMDDTIRQEEKDICDRWAELYGFNVAYLPLEKGLGRLTRENTAQVNASGQTKTRECTKSNVAASNNHSHAEEIDLGLDFSLPDDQNG